jgi:hypothetical protein
MRPFILLAAVAALSACSPAKAPAAKAPAPTFDVSLDVNELMVHVVQPAAFNVWGSAGYIINKDGETSLRPTTEAGWLNAENGAAALIEAGNVLMLPGRARDNGDWARYAHELTAAGKAAKAAIENKDEAAIFAAGDRIDVVCDQCHETYNPAVANRPDEKAHS